MNARTRQFLRDALTEAIALRADLSGADFRSFSRSRQRQRIAERSLEIIGEAIRRASREHTDLLIDQPELRDWILLRNVVSHQYDNLVLDVIWEAAGVELSELIETVESLLVQDHHH